MEKQIVIKINDKELIAIKDYNIYDIFYEGYNIGWFPVSKLERALQEIPKGFYDGRDYILRMKEVDERIKFILGK